MISATSPQASRYVLFVRRRGTNQEGQTHGALTRLTRLYDLAQRERLRIVHEVRDKNHRAVNQTSEGTSEALKLIESGVADGLICEDLADFGRNVVLLGKLSGLAAAGKLRSVWTLKGELLGKPTSTGLRKVKFPETSGLTSYRVYVQLTVIQKVNWADPAGSRRRLRTEARWLGNKLQRLITVLAPELTYRIGTPKVSKVKAGESNKAQVDLVTDVVDVGQLFTLVEGLRRHCQMMAERNIEFGHTSVSSVLYTLPS